MTIVLSKFEKQQMLNITFQAQKDSPGLNIQNMFSDATGVKYI